MLVLDTSAVDPRDRAEAFQVSVSANCTTSAATFEDPGRVRAEVHAFNLGSAKVLTIEACGTTLRRTPRMARAMNETPIALALPVRTSNHLVRDRDEELFGPRDLMLVDLSAPYLYGWSGGGASYAFHVDVDRLALPMDTIRKASGALRTSPIYSLVRDHVARVMTEAPAVADSPAAAHVGAASIEMMHALIVSAAGDAHSRASMQASALPRVQAFVRSHLRDVDLGPAQIAACNGVSVRTLYKLYEELDESLEQSIIRQRLEGARVDLAAPRLQHRSIEAIARSWGFASPSFFSHRFRQTYGASPRQWRISSAQPAPQDVAVADRAAGGPPPGPNRSRRDGRTPSPVVGAARPESVPV